MGSRFIAWAASFALAAGSPVLLASPGHSASDIGRPAAASAIGRTIEVHMGDNFYAPASIPVQAGESVRFVVKNTGLAPHEFSIDQAAGHAAHQKRMAAMFASTAHAAHEGNAMQHAGHGESVPAMHHVETNSVLVAPGDSSELLWTFADSGNLEFACNLPGHYQAGMVGRFVIQ